MRSRTSDAPVSGLIRPYSAIFSELFRLADLLLIFASYYAASWLQDVAWSVFFTNATLAAALVFVAYSQLFDVYGSWRIAGLRQEMLNLFFVWLATFFTLLFLAFAFKVSDLYSRRVTITWFFLAPLGLCALRGVIRYALIHLRLAGRNRRTAAVIGSGYPARQICKTIDQSPWLGIRLEGLYSHDPAADGTDANHSGRPVRPIRPLSVLLDKARNNAIDMVFIATPSDRHSQLEQLVAEFADTTVDVYFVPTLFMTDLLNSRWGYLGDLPYLSLHEPPFYGISGTLKRMEDVVFSLFILALIALPMLLIAIGIKTTSKGPVLFKQRRYGQNNQEVMVWKFRTMTVMEDGVQVAQAKRNDPRVTRFGAFLRKTSLDELPQFINVLQGHMSIVGPRPHAVAHNEHYRKEIYGYTVRHKVKPGITGWAQVNGWRGETDTSIKMKKRIDHDLWYISNWSILLDLKIIFLTVCGGFVGKQSY